ncbi:DUF924 family protein [Enterovibrio nigricans]|uniref:Uncharacterized conserved protein, DUF924 family n=1 Tax=Enterovibrio nigricans DSM 22720 TaxID=1121868 RepID=A0A1T4VTJ6_9GAMM|nr:DUF924 family protein [Enterovibrio nigricans]PKF49427.1 DUF924 domain-containing protein [Enterovibrio nigricans]SKA68286.1 Uncharacterized conserved protein, DUF924 family [Enterovibrio nigricans DSM 22720]
MYRNVLTFWFDELTPKEWFVKDEKLDETIKSRFGSLLEQAAKSECFEWRDEPVGRLAEIIVLDQFSRNIYRDTPKAFAQDPMALALAQEAVALGIDRELPPERRCFLYMPYMHSESAVVHEEAVRLFNQPGLEHNLDFEIRHKEIVDRFGRYPHRNAILGRESSPEELAFLSQPGSGF